jgi:serine/threonine-protein kinase RsbW
MPSVVRLEIPARRDHLALVRLVVSGAAAIERLVPERRLEDLRLAVSEACANAVDAQLKADGDVPLQVDIELDEAWVAVTVTDHAGGFEVAEVEAIPGATDPQRLGYERGLGIPLMRSLVDEVTFTATGDGTAVRLVVRSPDPAG